VKRFLCRLFRRAAVKAVPARPAASSPYRVAPPRLPEPVVLPTRVRFTRSNPRPQGNLCAVLVITQVAVGVIRLCTETIGPTRFPTNRFNARWSPPPPVSLDERKLPPFPTAAVRYRAQTAATSASAPQAAREANTCKKPPYCKQ
jgi:hypothetical protein